MVGINERGQSVEDLSENLGYGLRKLIRWQEVTGRPMHIETTINAVKVISDLQTRDTGKTDVAKNVAKKLTERQQQIVALISENPHTRAEIALAIGVATNNNRARTRSSIRHSPLRWFQEKRPLGDYNH